MDDVKVKDPAASAQAFHGLEIPVRTLTGARALRIVHPSGQQIAPHRHDWPLLTIPLLGGYDEEVDGASVDIAGPAVVLHPPGRCHANCIHNLGMETFSIEFDPAWLGCGGSLRLLDRSLYWVAGPVPLAARLLARSWANAGYDEGVLQAETARFLRMAVASRGTRPPPWLDLVRQQIMSDAAATASRIAPNLGMHPRWLAHAYRQAAGEGLHDTLLRRRVEQAAHLLRSTNQPIADIAFSVGLCDQSHLNRVVGRFTGRTPGQLRAEGKQLDMMFSG